jgi:hypothetical protein
MRHVKALYFINLEAWRKSRRTPHNQRCENLASNNNNLIHDMSFESAPLGLYGRFVSARSYTMAVGSVALPCSGRSMILSLL